MNECISVENLEENPLPNAAALVLCGAQGIGQRVGEDERGPCVGKRPKVGELSSESLGFVELRGMVVVGEMPREVG